MVVRKLFLLSSYWIVNIQCTIYKQFLYINFDKVHYDCFSCQLYKILHTLLYFYMYYFTRSLFKLGIHILLISIQIVYFLILSFIFLYVDQILQIEISYVCYLLKSMEIVKNVDNSNI